MVQVFNSRTYFNDPIINISYPILTGVSQPSWSPEGGGQGPSHGEGEQDGDGDDG